MKALLELLAHQDTATCGNCGKEKEAVVIKTMEYTVPVCARCLFIEARKRTPKKGAKAETPEGSLFEGAQP